MFTLFKLTGQSSPSEDGSPDFYEHLPSSGVRSHAAGYQSCTHHTHWSQTGYRGHHHHEWGGHIYIEIVCIAERITCSLYNCKYLKKTCIRFLNDFDADTYIELIKLCFSLSLGIFS